MSDLSRRSLLGLSAAATAAAALPSAAQAAPAVRGAAPATGDFALLTDPFLQLPELTSVRVVWFTEAHGSTHHVLVGKGVETLTVDDLRPYAARLGTKVPRSPVTVHTARTTRLSRAAEDAGSQLPADRKPAAGIAPRPVFRHEAQVRGIPRGAKAQPYRVLSVDGTRLALSRVFTLTGSLKPGKDAVIMLTSDHQAMVNTPANIHFAKETITRELGPIAAVFFAGDLVNIPDRASEWFDDTRGSAFFPVLQGNGGRAGTDGIVYRGADVIQHAPIFPAIGNHEVQGRIAGHTSLNASFNNAVPVEVAEAEYAKVAARVNPTGSPTVKAAWIEDNSFSSRTYEEIFSLPGNERWYAVTVGDVRLVTLYSTRIWRGTAAQPEPGARTAVSRYQESAGVLDTPLEQGHGEFIFEDIGVGSPQYRWLEREVASREFRSAKYRIVMLHEGPQGLGDNVMAHFAHPVRTEERDADGTLVGIRYDYPEQGNVALHDLQPLLEQAGVDLVYNGHSHLWNRFTAASGTHFLEASNTGNSYGAFHPLSGRSRPVPPAPWDADNYLAQGNPGGLTAVVPTIAPLRQADGTPLPFIADNRYVVFQALHTGTGVVTSWYVDMQDTGAGAVRFDEFRL